MFCEVEGILNGQLFKRLYEKKCEPIMKKYNLRKIELDVLFFLYSYKSYDTARDIANHKCLSKSHVSNAIEILTEREYLQAIPDECDRRYVHLIITKQAKPILEELGSLWSSLHMAVYQDISTEERLLLTQVMKKVISNINNLME
jgi:DNA-binding MarR family transcriptional regulator